MVRASIVLFVSVLSLLLVGGNTQALKPRYVDLPQPTVGAALHISGVGLKALNGTLPRIVLLKALAKTLDVIPANITFGRFVACTGVATVDPKWCSLDTNLRTPYVAARFNVTLKSLSRALATAKIVQAVTFEAAVSRALTQVLSEALNTKLMLVVTIRTLFQPTPPPPPPASIKVLFRLKGVTLRQFYNSTRPLLALKKTLAASLGVTSQNVSILEVYSCPMDTRCQKTYTATQYLVVVLQVALPSKLLLDSTQFKLLDPAFEQDVATKLSASLTTAVGETVTVGTSSQMDIPEPVGDVRARLRIVGIPMKEFLNSSRPLASLVKSLAWSLDRKPENITVKAIFQCPSDERCPTGASAVPYIAVMFQVSVRSEYVARTVAKVLSSSTFQQEVSERLSIAVSLTIGRKVALKVGIVTDYAPPPPPAPPAKLLVKLRLNGITLRQYFNSTRPALALKLTVAAALGVDVRNVSLVDVFFCYSPSDTRCGKDTTARYLVAILQVDLRQKALVDSTTKKVEDPTFAPQLSASLTTSLTTAVGEPVTVVTSAQVDSSGGSSTPASSTGGSSGGMVVVAGAVGGLAVVAVVGGLVWRSRSSSSALLKDEI